MATGKKKNNYIEHGGTKMLAMIPLFFLFLLKISFMTRKIGVSGMAYFAMAAAVFAFIYGINGNLIAENVRKMVLFQVNRRSVRNAIKLNRVILQFSSSITIIIAVCMFIFSEKISVVLFVTPLASLPIKIASVVLVLLVPQQCMKGYLEGISSQVPGVVSMFIMAIIDLVTTVLIQNSCMQQGRKVAAIMRNDQYYYAYSSISGIIGICVGAFFSLLFLLLITGLLKQMQKERMRSDESKSKLSSKDILHNYIVNDLKEFVANIFGPLMLLVFYVLLLHHTQDAIEETGIIFISIFMALPIFFHNMGMGKFSYRQIHSMLRRSEQPQARDKIASALKADLYFTFMLSIFYIFTAKSINIFLFDQSKEELIGVFKYTQTIMMLFGIAVFLLNLLIAYMGSFIADLLYIVGVGAFLVFQMVLLGNGMTGVSPFLGAMLICMLWLMLSGGFALFKKSRYKNDLIRVFILPSVAATGLLLVCLLIDKVLFESMSAMGCVIVAIFGGYFSYQLIIILTHTFDKHEWMDLPFANVPVFLAKKLNMY